MKKLSNALFCLVFIAMLLLPLVTMNFKKDQVSEIDNAYLPELKLELSRNMIPNTEKYINARIGFRTEALDLYQKLNTGLFGIMEHPSYMYGKEGHVFFRFDSYIRDYQHLNLDEAWARDFADAMQFMSDCAKEQGAAFIYMLVPDKKTVYSEFFPDSINVQGDISRTDQVLAQLSNTDVHWIYVKDVLVESKKSIPVCNTQYDAGHWNQNGAFVSYQHLYDHIRGYFPQVQPLDAQNYTLESITATSLQTSRFQIHEQIPNYVLKEQNAVADSSWLKANLFFPEENSYYTRYVNSRQQDMPRLLVFHDSYMFNHEKFFSEHFSEVIFIHRNNLVNLQVYQEYLERIDPDLVIYENPERTFPITFHGEYTIPG